MDQLTRTNLFVDDSCVSSHVIAVHCPLSADSICRELLRSELVDAAVDSRPEPKRMSRRLLQRLKRMNDPRVTDGTPYLMGRLW